jgi:hypothetical protein
METKNQTQQQQINDRDGACAPVQKFFQSRYYGTHQVGKENGEQEGHQRCPRHVEESQPQRE